MRGTDGSGRPPLKRASSGIFHVLSDFVDGSEFDIVVAGAGAAGLAAAICGAARGARVLVVENTDLVGGTTAYTAGTLWIPGTHLALEAGGPSNDVELAERYLDEAVGDRSDRRLRAKFLHTGPEAVKTLAAEEGMKFRVRPHHPDYMAELPDAAPGFRPIEAFTVDGGTVPGLDHIRQQTQEFTVFGGMMLEHPEIAAFSRFAAAPLNLANWGIAVRAGLIFAKHIVTRPFHARATRMTMGNALVGRLMIALHSRAVPIVLSTTVEQIVSEGGGVAGVVLEQHGTRRTFSVAGGLISATGGFNRSPKRRETLLPEQPLDWSPIAPGSTGQLLEQIDELGGHYRELPDSAAFWAPVSLPPRSDGSHGVYPHFALDRGKPGFIVVDQTGARYLNESTSYHRFGLAMQQRADGKGMPSYLIGDAAAVARYGIGAVKPGGWGTRRRLRDGYLVRASTLEGLAVKLGMIEPVLRSSVDALNEYAATGIDPDQARGTNLYERNLGEPGHGPNPSIGALTRGPFYAIKLYPGDIGAATGFVTDENARVLRADGSTIDGLYAIGNDMQSIMGDRYPGPGITLGPAVVFGYIAAQDASERAIAVTKKEKK